MRHIFLVPDGVTSHTGNHIFCVNAEQLSDWGCHRSVVVFLFAEHEYVRVMREAVPL